MDKKLVVLCGFFGKGNAGDESFLHVLYNRLHEKFDLAIVLERGSIHPDCVSWHPYNKCELWAFDEVHRLYDDRVEAIHVGGGSLPFGFYGHYILSALDAGKKVLMSGIDGSPRTKAKDGNLKKFIFSQLDFISVRTKKSFKMMRAEEVKVLYGADLALGLKPDESFISNQEVDIAIVTRGFSEPTQYNIDNLMKLLGGLNKMNRSVTFLPFAPEDNNFLEFCGIPQQDIISSWHDPQNLINIFSNAKAVISIGRLHGLIFSLICQKPTFAIDPGIHVNGKHILNRKNAYFCKETGLEFFDSVDEFMELSKEDKEKILSENKSFSTDFFRRFEKMSDQLSHHFNMAQRAVI